MNSKEWAREMALYNKWQNETLYGRCDGLSDEVRKADRGMFFTSIHRTLDHILMVDEVLRGFVEHGMPENFVFDPNKAVHENYEVLKAARIGFDDSLLKLFDAHAGGWLDTTLTFDSDRLGRPRTLPRKFYCMQMFNHGISAAGMFFLVGIG